MLKLLSGILLSFIFLSSVNTADAACWPACTAPAWCWNNQCVMCTNNNHCAGDPGGPICSGGQCVTCTTDTHCVGNPAGPVCDTANNQCVTCMWDAHCNGNPAGPVCDTSTNNCVGCLDSSHCPDTDCTTRDCLGQSCQILITVNRGDSCLAGPGLCTGPAANPANQCVTCFDDSEVQDTGCSSAQPHCSDAVSPGQCQTCVDDVAGTGLDSGCSAQLPMCLGTGGNITCGECGASADCMNNANGNLCTGNNTCGCALDADCDSTDVCDTGNGICRDGDHDDDGIPDTIDIDDDDDGIPDIVEGYGQDGSADDDADGTPNWADPDHALNDANHPLHGGWDWDGDGVPNHLDLDSDNDGILDAVEGHADNTHYDQNGDGHLDTMTDADGDGLRQQADADESGVAAPTPDMDGDNHPDYLDLDTDGDSIPDVIEGGNTDTNNDGMIDVADSDGDSIIGPADFDASDSDDDGIVAPADGSESGNPVIDHASGSAPAPGTQLTDTDLNQRPDFRDVDSDDDGIPDFVEGQDDNGDGQPDIGWPPAGTDADGDGWDTMFDPSEGGAAPVTPDHDGDAAPDYQDIDSDDDGSGDGIENPGQGVGDGSGDSDGDGWVDQSDTDPEGHSGPWDTSTLAPDDNGDGVPDYLDPNSGVPAYSGGARACSSGGGGNLMLFLILGFGLLLKKRRRASVAAATLGALLLCEPSVTLVEDADAQSIFLDRFRAPSTVDDAFALRRPLVGKHLSWGVQLYFDYANDPLTVERTAGNASSEFARVVQHQVNITVGVHINIKDRFVLFGGLPVTWMTGDENLAAMGFLEHDSFGLSDAFAGARARLVGLDSDDYEISAQAAVAFPSAGSSQTFRGDEGITVAPELLAEYRINQKTWITADLGLRLRPSAQQALNLEAGHEFTYGAGLGYRFWQKKSKPATKAVAHLQVWGSADLSTSDGLALEALAGARYHHNGRWIFGLAAGPGITRGFGSPDVRVIGMLAYRPRHGKKAPKKSAKPAGPADRDKDGILDSDDTCPDKPETMNEYKDDDGCPDDPDRDDDGIWDRVDNCPDEPGKEEFNGCNEKQMVTIEDGRLAIIDNVYFKYNKDVILEKSYPLLRNVAKVLNAHTEVTMVHVEGHTDTRGNDAYNKDLSQRRADSVVRFLVEEGVNSSRLKGIGYGEERPKIENATSKDEHAQNRRVEFRLVGGEGITNQQSDAGSDSADF